MLAPLDAADRSIPTTRISARDLLSKGVTWARWIILEHRRIAAPPTSELLADGVEFIQEPVEQPYGVECVMRDPFGNQIRIGQSAPPA